jgi:hypothetical protein
MLTIRNKLPDCHGPERGDELPDGQPARPLAATKDGRKTK